MKQALFGKSGQKVSAIGIGTWGYGGYFRADTADAKPFRELIRYAVDHGINFIDTAEAYAEGRSESILGEAIATYDRSSIFIAGKVSPENLKHNNLLKAAESSLGRLKCDYLDLYQIHWPNQSIPLDETLSAMSQLHQEGKIRHFGLSNFCLQGLKKVIATGILPLESIQVEYNLFDRSAETELLPYCREHEVILIAYSPLDQGKKTSIQGQQALDHLARKYGQTAAQITLNYLVSQGVIAIPKTMSLKHMKEICEATSFALEAEDISLIRQAFPNKIQHMNTDNIVTDKKGLENFNPGVDVLAEALKSGESLKPIRVMPINGGNKYQLVEGKLRYWAWVQAFGTKKPLPTQVRH